MTEKKKNRIKTIAGYALCALIPVVFFLLFRIAGVDGESMESTYHNGNLVLVSNFSKVDKGDIIAINVTVDGEKEKYIKRVIGLEGDVIDIRAGKVYVNEEELDEPYIKEEMQEYEDSIAFPHTVGEDEIFVMGDNRNNSLDSRSKHLEPIRTNDVIGVVLFKL